MNDTMKPLRRKLLLETLRHYNSENRSLDTIAKRCVYVGLEGRRCAIGRILDDRTIDRLTVSTNRMSINMLIDYYDGHLIDRYKELEGDLRFLALVQSIHDQATYWNPNGFSSDSSKRDDLTVHMGDYFSRSEMDEIFAEL